MTWIVLILFLVVAAIMVFALFGKGEKTREDFLQQLVELTEGKLTNISDKASSYVIKFEFEGYDFIYEDFELEGFSEKFYKTNLKLPASSKYSLELVEKDRGATKSKIMFASKIPDQIDKVQVNVQLPKSLQDFKAITNNVRLTNKLFKEDKIVHIFTMFKNLDSRGIPFSSIKINNGLIVLEFHSSGNYAPQSLNQQNNITNLERYLDQLRAVAVKIRTL